MPNNTMLAALIALFSGQLLSATETSKPNVILIMADDLGYHDLASYGHPSIKTPVLDQLATEGLSLTNFHAGSTVCTPSRMALLTGAYPVRLGWTEGVIGYKMAMTDALSPKALTIAEIFQSDGYSTAISGKWHIGTQPETLPHRRGFQDNYFIPLSNNQTDEIWRDDKIIEKPFENRLLTEKFTTEAIRFLRENKNKPFFLYLPYSAPHFPVEPHPEWKDHSAFGKYGDVVEEMDHRIGQLLTTLKELDLEKNTIVIFTSDNGPQPREAADSKPFRGEKWSALEGGTRVPFIIRWPGKIPAARTSDKLISAMDLLPTLSRAANIDWTAKSSNKPKIDGLDILETLLGNEENHPRTELLLWHGLDSQPQAITSGDWKLFLDRRHALEGPGTARITPQQAAKIAPYQQSLKPDTPNPPMLFNLRDDPGETIDLSEKFPEKVTTLKKRAAELHREIISEGTLPIFKPADR